MLEINTNTSIKRSFNKTKLLIIIIPDIFSLVVVAAVITYTRGILGNIRFVYVTLDDHCDFVYALDGKQKVIGFLYNLFRIVLGCNFGRKAVNEGCKCLQFWY